MRVIPVLDLMHGVVVRGQAGLRHQYRPVASNYFDCAEPEAVADALVRRYGFDEFYVADLDGILKHQPNWACFQRLADRGWSLAVDAGVRSTPDGKRLLAHGAKAVVAGLETVPDPETLADLVQHLGEHRVIFSLDLKNGRPMGGSAFWGDDPIELLRTAYACGVERFLILDLARVGMGGGVGTESLVAEAAALHDDVEVLCGGGVRCADDLRRLADLGADGVLVATSLHNGALSADDVQRCKSFGKPHLAGVH
ncbi:MAG: HisA/HisF-related TIM barrel protein [Planctomycetia bacterium]